MLKYSVLLFLMLFTVGTVTTYAANTEFSKSDVETFKNFLTGNNDNMTEIDMVFWSHDLQRVGNDTVFYRTLPILNEPQFHYEDSTGQKHAVYLLNNETLMVLSYETEVNPHGKIFNREIGQVTYYGAENTIILTEAHIPANNGYGVRPYSKVSYNTDGNPVVEETYIEDGNTRKRYFENGVAVNG